MSRLNFHFNHIPPLMFGETPMVYKANHYANTLHFYSHVPLIERAVTGEFQRKETRSIYVSEDYKDAFELLTRRLAETQIIGETENKQLAEQLSQQFVSVKEQLAQMKVDLAKQQSELGAQMREDLSKQKTELGAQMTTTKDELMAKNSSSLVTISGSVFGFGKITEAFSKAVDLVQGMRGAWRGLSTVGTNVDNVSFPRQLGRAAMGGARGTLKIGAAGLGAAVVMSAVLATSGIALNKMHDVYPSIPSVGQVVSSVAHQAEKLKVAVGVFEVEKAGGPEAKTLAASERASALLAQEGGNFTKAVEKVNLALGQSYINDASAETIAKQKELLTTLQVMQASAHAALMSPSSPTAPAP